MKTQGTLIIPVHYPQPSAVAYVDHVEIEGMHSHRSPRTYGADLRNLRTAVGKSQSFGTALADLLVEALVPNRK